MIHYATKEKRVIVVIQNMAHPQMEKFGRSAPLRKKQAEEISNELLATHFEK